MAKKKPQPTRHRLKGDTLVNEGGGRGITAECVCGWKMTGCFSSASASAHFQNHVDEVGDSREDDDEG